MATRRELIDAEDYQRRRGVAALTRGDTLDIEEVPRRPNAALWAGIVVALLIGAVSAATAFLGGRAPDGWNADGTLVVDKQTGAAYVAEAGLLRPAPTIAAARLAGARAVPVLVDHGKVTGSPAGPPLPTTGTLDSPPAMPSTPGALVACITAPQAIDVFIVPPLYRPSPAGGLLARSRGTDQIFLVADRAKHRVTEASALALGYSLGQVRDVPAPWLDLAPLGPDMVLLRSVPSSSGGLPGIGASGDTVVAAGTGQRFLVSEGLLRPFANRTTELLVPPPARALPDAVLRAAPGGPPAGLSGVPDVPPAVPGPEDPVQPCVRSSDGLLTVADGVGDGVTRPAPPHAVVTGGPPAQVVWHFPPGQGALLGPPDLDAPRPPGSNRRRDDGIVVVDAGVGYPVVGDDVLRSLGYDHGQALPVPRPWFALVAPGTVLVGRP